MTRSLVGCALLLLAACGRSEAGDGLSRTEFVTTYVALRRATVAGVMDPATRDSILEAHGTTADELRAYIEQRAEDPDAIADTWREIMDSIAARDTVATHDDTIPDSE